MMWRAFEALLKIVVWSWAKDVDVVRSHRFVLVFTTREHVLETENKGLVRKTLKAFEP